MLGLVMVVVVVMVGEVGIFDESWSLRTEKEGSAEGYDCNRDIAQTLVGELYATKEDRWGYVRKECAKRLSAARNESARCKGI